MELFNATVLLVVDVQKAFDEWEASGMRRNNARAIDRIASLLRAFRALQMPIIHVRHEGTHPNSRFRKDRDGFCVREEAREEQGEPVIVKTVNSAFIGTNLEERLRASGIRTIVLCGATTNHCVETTARMAGNLGFDVRVVRDATWTFDRIGPDGELHAADDVHAMSLANLNGEFGKIVRTEDVLVALPLI